MISTTRFRFSLTSLSYILALCLTAAPSGIQAAEEKSPQPGTTSKQQLPAKPAISQEFKNEEEKINYAIGVQMAGNFQRQGHKVNVDMLARGMRDALSGKGLALPDGELRRLIMIYQNAVKRGYMQQKKNAAEKKQ